MTRSCGNSARMSRARRKWPVPALVFTAALCAGPPTVTAADAVTGTAVARPTAQRTLAVVRGTVTNSYTSAGIPGATVTFATLTTSKTATTDANGAYTVILPANAYYDVTMAAENYQPYSVSGSFVRRIGNNLSRALEPVARVLTSAVVEGVAEPGATLDLTGTCTPLDGSTVLSTEWVQTGGTMADIADWMAAQTTATLAPVSAFKDALIHALKEPPLGNDELPPNVPPPPGEFVGGLQDRFQVVGIVPYTLEHATGVGLEFVCETTSGVYTAEQELATKVPWVVTTGLRTVPINVAALLHAKENLLGYQWQILSRPPGSSAALADAETQSPWFTPDASGIYEIQENLSGHVLTVHAGLYHGAIDPLLTINSVVFGDGLPVGDENCTSCHDGTLAPDAFTPWRETGHAHAFSDGLNTNDHFSDRCFSCHAVGVNADAFNAGMDDTPNYQSFLTSGLLNNPNPDNWLDMLLSYPDTARLANIQCENCHGPQSYTQAHQQGEPRVSIASEVCASCHGEPARHGRYQQWQLSRHANYELAVDEGDSGNCSRCHTGNGFVAWSKLDFDKDASVAVTWDAETVHPQTCATCHGPHETGTLSGDDPIAGVRIEGDSPELIAGYKAIGIGKGALCITCHNTRRGMRNDDVFAGLSDSDKTRGPHGPTQGDLMMGQNAYFVDVGIRGKHSLIDDTCVTCHMEETPPPAQLSYNQSGTNHTFFASDQVCAKCHGSLNADGVRGTVTSLMANLAAAQGEGYETLLKKSLPATIGGDCGNTLVTDASEIAGVTWNSSTSITVALTSGASCTRNPNAITVTWPGVTNLYQLSLLPEGGDGALVKAAWNYSMSNNDGSLGLHNPGFTTEMLQAALNAVSAIQ